MIYLFVWENYFRKKLITSWKASFAQKFSEHNIIHISNVFEYELSFFEQNLLSSGFFSEKNLFIIDDFPFWSDEENSWDVQKIQEYFLQILPKVNADNIVVFNSQKADKRSKIYKEISKLWEIKDFVINDINDLSEKLKEVYKDRVSSQALQKMIDLKWLNFWNIANELEKLLITKEYIDIQDIALVTKDLEESIFDIINDILSCETKKAIWKLRELADSLDNPYFLYNSLASNLRVYFYIFKLKWNGQNSTQVKDTLELGNRAFLVDKNYKIDKKKFINIYEKVAAIDGKMKSGKMIGNDSADMMYEIERCFI